MCPLYQIKCNLKVLDIWRDKNTAIYPVQHFLSNLISFSTDRDRIQCKILDAIF